MACCCWDDVRAGRATAQIRLKHVAVSPCSASIFPAGNTRCEVCGGTVRNVELKEPPAWALRSGNRHARRQGGRAAGPRRVRHPASGGGGGTRAARHAQPGARHHHPHQQHGRYRGDAAGSAVTISDLVASRGTRAAGTGGGITTLSRLMYYERQIDHALRVTVIMACIVMISVRRKRWSLVLCLLLCATMQLVLTTIAARNSSQS